VSPKTAESAAEALRSLGAEDSRSLKHRIASFTTFCPPPAMKRILLTSLLTFSLIQAESVKDREGAVRADKAKMEADKRWAYNDVESGFQQAKLTGKPVLVVMRCVPCLACMGLDSAVLMESDALSALLDQFVCVRVINANARGLGTDGMALWVKGLGMYGPHAAAKNAGFQKEDVLIEVVGIKERISESRLHGHLMQEHFKGEQVPVKVLRGGRTLELKLPMQ